MIALLQRVSTAQVVVEDELIAEIAQGLLVLLGVERGDSEQQADRMLQRLLGFRVFNDGQGEVMNKMLSYTGKLLLLYSLIFSIGWQFKI